KARCDKDAGQGAPFVVKDMRSLVAASLVFVGVVAFTWILSGERGGLGLVNTSKQRGGLGKKVPPFRGRRQLVREGGLCPPVPTSPPSFSQCRTQVSLHAHQFTAVNSNNGS